MTRDHADVLDRIGERLAPEGEAFERIIRRRETKAIRRRASAGVVGLSVAVALIAGVLALASARPGPAGRVIRPAGSGVPLVAQPGQYYYVRFSMYQVGDGGAIRRGGTGELWVGPDDSGRIVWTGSGTSTDQTDDRYQPGDFPGQILDLSGSPDGVIQQLIQRGSVGGASPNAIATTSPGRSQETTSLLRTLEDLMTFASGAFLTPEQIQGVFVGAQTISDVTTTTGVTDPLDRQATRLSFVIDYGQRPSEVDWYFDPDTGQFMGEVWVEQETRAVQVATLIEAAGIAPSMDDVPAPDALYVPRGADQPSFGVSHS